MTKKEIPAFAFFFALTAFNLAAADAPKAESGDTFRNTTTGTLVEYTTGSWRHELENLFVWNVSPDIKPLVDITRTETDYGKKTLVQLGLINVFDQGVYSQTQFGQSVDDRGATALAYSFELTKEGTLTIWDARIRGGMDDETSVSYWIPDVSVRHQFGRWYAAKVRYFYGWNSDGGSSHSIQLEHYATISERFWISVGTTAIREDTGVEGSSPQNLWSAGAAINGQITRNVGIKYSYLYETIAKGESGTENTLAVNLKF